MKFVLYKKVPSWQLILFIHDQVEIHSETLQYNTTIYIKPEYLKQFFSVTFRDSLSEENVQRNFLNSEFCRALDKEGGQNVVHHFYYDSHPDGKHKYESLSCVCFPTEKQWGKLNVKTFPSRERRRRRRQRRKQSKQQVRPYKLALAYYRPIAPNGRKKFDVIVYYGIGSVFELAESRTRFGEKRFTLDPFKKFCINFHLKEREDAEELSSLSSLFQSFENKIPSIVDYRETFSDLRKKASQVLFKAVNTPRNQRGFVRREFREEQNLYRWYCKESRQGKILNRKEYVAENSEQLFTIAGRLRFPEQLTEEIEQEVRILLNEHCVEQKPRRFKKAAICKRFLVKGRCSEGEKCEFMHVKRRDCLPTLSLKIQSKLPNETSRLTICPFLFFNKHCRKGDRCNLVHIREDLSDKLKQQAIESVQNALDLPKIRVHH